MTVARLPGSGGSWTAHPRAGTPQGILFLEAFGRLSTNTEPPSVTPGDGVLWSVFLARAAMMGWATLGESGRPRGEHWSVHEAELDTDPDSSRIGWAQVGLDAGVSPVRALPSAIQCLDDALRRFGTTEVSGLQLTASHLQPGDGSFASDLVSWLSWFSVTAGPEVETVVAMDDGLLRSRGDPEWLDSLHSMSSAPFHFGPLVPVPAEQAINLAAEAPFHVPLIPADRGISVGLPEWSAPAAAWALGFVVAAALTGTSGASGFAVRLTKPG